MIVDKIAMYLYQWIRLYKLHKLMENFFPEFELVFELMAENRKIFEQIARCEYWLKCNVLLYIWIRLYNL